MPYTVVKNHPKCNGYAVVKSSSPKGHVFGCHPSAKQAGAQIGAITRSEKSVNEDALAQVPADLPGELPDGWRGVIAGLDIPTGDGRYLATPPGGVRTRVYPLSLTLNHVGDGEAPVIGSVDRVWVQDGMLMGEGKTDLGGQAGADFARQLQGGFINTVSIHPDQLQAFMGYMNLDGSVVNYDQLDDPSQIPADAKEVVVFADWRLAGLAVVPIPAYTEARIEGVYGYVPSEHSAMDAIVAGVAGSTSLPVADTGRAWDGGGAGGRILDAATKNGKINVASASRGFLWRDGDGSKRGDYKFPFADVINGTLTIVPRGVSAAAARLNQAQGVDQAAIGRKICSLYAKIKKSDKTWPDCPVGMSLLQDGNGQYPQDGQQDGNGGNVGGPINDTDRAFLTDIKAHHQAALAMAAKYLSDGSASNADVIEFAADVIGDQAEEIGEISQWLDAGNTDEGMSLVASVVGGQVFNELFFTDPNLDGPTPLTISDTGHIFGHVALWESCYQYAGGGNQFATCQKPPHSATNYSRFHVHRANLGDGEFMSVGVLTYGDGHIARGGLKASQENYANVATQAAKVVAGEDRYGIWVSGEVLDSARDSAHDILDSPLSGHWEPDADATGNLELIAAHVVNVPGFAVRPIIASFGDGHTLDGLTLTSKIARKIDDIADLAGTVADMVIAKMELREAQKIKTAAQAMADVHKATIVARINEDARKARVAALAARLSL